LVPADPLRPVIIALGAQLLIVAAFFQLADAAQVMALGLLRGVQDTRVPMISRRGELLAGRNALRISAWLSQWDSGATRHLVGPRHRPGACRLAYDLARFWTGPVRPPVAPAIVIARGLCLSAGPGEYLPGNASTVPGRDHVDDLECTTAALLARRWPLGPPLAQDFPNLARGARASLFAEDGAVELGGHSPTPRIDPADEIATLDAIQHHPAAALLCRAGAGARSAGLASEITALDGQLPRRGECARRRAGRLRGESRRRRARPCIVGLVIRPQGWEPGRPLQLVGAGDGGAAER
jgi:hypothetical protein